jgi:hypothetical protein
MKGHECSQLKELVSTLLKRIYMTGPSDNEHFTQQD